MQYLLKDAGHIMKNMLNAAEHVKLPRTCLPLLW